MPLRFRLFLWLLRWFHHWILHKPSLTPKQLQRVNGALWRFRHIEYDAIDIGATSGGKPDIERSDFWWRF